MNEFAYDSDFDDNHSDGSQDEDLKNALKLSLNYDLEKTIEISKNENLELFTEELQLEAALKLSLSTKQPPFKRPVGKIYTIDHIIKDIFIDYLIERGCLKMLYSFCLTRWNYYDMIMRKRRMINSKLISCKQLDPSVANFDTSYFQNYKYFKINTINKFNKTTQVIFTKQYYIVANSDKCGCVSKNTILYIKIPWSIIGTYRKNKFKKFGDLQNVFFHKEPQVNILFDGILNNIDVVNLLNKCSHDNRCDQILNSKT